MKIGDLCKSAIFVVLLICPGASGVPVEVINESR